MKPRIIIPLIFSIVLDTIQLSYQYSCHDDSDTCEDGFNTVYRDKIFATDEQETLYRRYCCKPEKEEIYRNEATECRPTKCVPQGAADTCSSIHPDRERFINGTEKLVWDELLSDPCKTDDGQPGRIGLCCSQDVYETVLASVYGAEPNEFPHQARIKPINCGGTIYNENYILTAAHCVVEKGVLNPEHATHVVVGTNIGDMHLDLAEYAYPVEKIIVHQGYSKFKANGPSKMTFNDVALLKLKSPLKFSKTIKALPLAPLNFNPNAHSDKMIMVGWGTTENLKLAPHLQKLNFLLRKDERCYAQDKTGILPNTFWALQDYRDQLICAGGIMDGTRSGTVGNGDSGGPAICRSEDGTAVLCGITSFGLDDAKCKEFRDAKHCIPSTFAEVAYFRKWIEEKTNSQGQSETSLYKPYVYGKDINSGEYDHQVYITSSTGRKCGGTLISPNIVVTPAQCVSSPGSKALFPGLRVSIGIKNIQQSTTKHKVTGARVHSGFKMRGTPVNIQDQGHTSNYYLDPYHHSDLAVIKISGQAPASTKFPQLPTSGIKFPKGTDVSYPRDVAFYKSLRARSMNILEKDECQKRLDRIGRRDNSKINLDDNTLCAVEEYSGGSTCDSVLGGALLCKKGKHTDVFCGMQIFRTCSLTLPYNYVDLAHPSNLDFLEQAKKELEEGE